MYQENLPSTEEIVDVYADNIPATEGTMLDVALPVRKQHFEVKKNDLFTSTLNRPGLKKIYDPENRNDVIDVIMLKPVIKVEDGKIDIEKDFELILERPMEPVSESANKVIFNSEEPEIIDVAEDGSLSASVKLGQTYVTCLWPSGVIARPLVTVGSVSMIKPFLPNSGGEDLESPVVVPGVPVETYEELLSAIESEGEIKLEADLEVPDYIEIRDKNIVIYLNGHTITHPASSEAKYKDVFEVYGSSSLTIYGEGKVIAENGYCIYATGDSKVNINGGYYFSPVSVIDARKNASVIINDGEFFVDGSNNPDGDFGQKFTLNLRDKTGNYASELSEIVVKGGKYYKFDPSNNESNGVGTNYLPEEYISKQEGDYYVVSQKEIIEEPENPQPEEPVEPAMVMYGYMPIAEHMTSIDAITAEDLAAVEYTEVEVAPLDKTLLPAIEANFIVVLVPASSELAAYRFDGVGGMEPFYETIMGCNGQKTYMINGNEYKLYAELQDQNVSDYYIFVA